MAVIVLFVLQVAPVYELNTTNLSLWDDEVKNKAIHIIESYLNNSPCKYEPIKPVINEEKMKMDVASRNFCTVCNRLFLGDKVYEIHLKSFRHMKVLKKKQNSEKASTSTTEIEESSAK